MDYRARMKALQDDTVDDGEDTYTRFVQNASPVGAVRLPEAERTAVVKLQLLSAADVSRLLAAAIRMEAEYTIKGGKSMYAHLGPKSWHAASHEVLYFHRDGWLAREEAELQARLVSAMVRHAAWCPADAELSVRCVELHRYTEGGSLPNPGHRDKGSVVTMSVLLSDPGQCEGGTFVVWDDRGRPIEQPVGQGEAVVFHSERVHNVSPVIDGERLSLVLELWTGGTNSVDRQS